MSLTSIQRIDTGTSASRKLRSNGFVPGVLYIKDKNHSNVSISIPKVLLESLTKNVDFMNKVYELKIFKKEDNSLLATHQVVPKDIQFDKISSHISHLDLALVEDEIKVRIPLSFKNKDKCNALKFGGSLVVLEYNPLVKVKSSNIPSKLEIDLTGLPSGKVIRLSDLKNQDIKIIKDYNLIKITGKREVASEEEKK